MKLRRYEALVAVIVATALWASAAWARPIPPSPDLAVLDETYSLTIAINLTLRRLLTEHDRITGERVVLAIFTSAEGETIEALSRRVFNDWKIGDPTKDNGALLAIFVKERHAWLMTGSGLDVGEAERKKIVEERVLPELSAGDTSRAAVLGVLELLRTLHSPLVAEGKAEKALRVGGFTGAFRAREWTSEPVIGARGGWLLFLLGLALFGAVLMFVLAAEAHFTSSGWFRPSPWRWERWKFELLNPKGARSSLGGSHGAW